MINAPFTSSSTCERPCNCRNLSGTVCLGLCRRSVVKYHQKHAAVVQLLCVRLVESPILSNISTIFLLTPPSANKFYILVMWSCLKNDKHAICCVYASLSICVLECLQAHRCVSAFCGVYPCLNLIRYFEIILLVLVNSNSIQPETFRRLGQNEPGWKLFGILILFLLSDM